MKTALIATLGNRDLQVDINLLEQYIPENTKKDEYFNSKNNNILARKAGELILQNYEELRHKLQIPILIPTIEYLTSQHSQIDLMILIATDQKNNPHPQDTIYYAQIIQKYLPEKFPNKLPDIRIAYVKETTVTYLDNMFQYFEKTINNKPFSAIDDNFGNIYLHLVGGIDAIQNAFRWQAIKKWGNKITEELYVNENTKICIPIKSVNYFIKDFHKQTASNLIERYYYEAIEQFDIPESAKQIARSAHFRLLFDFEQAICSLNNISSEYRDIQEEIIREIRPLRDENSEALLKEIFWNAYIKYQQKNYIDFLSRMFRFYEEYLKKECIRILNIKYKRGNWSDVFISYLEKEGKDLKEYLDNEKIEYKKSDPSTRLLLEILRYKKHPHQDILNEITKLSQLRNNSIAAHSFEPTNEQIIKDKLGYEPIELFQQLKLLVNITDIDIENPYMKYNKHIMDILNKQ